jgi:hypothetical protein
VLHRPGAATGPGFEGSGKVLTDDAWLDTVRIARDLGDVSVLFPPGVTSLTELPHSLFDAIRLGLTFLRFEEMDEDEQPPREIWLDNKRLTEHMKMVRRMRKEKYDGGSEDIASVPIDGPSEQNAMLDEMGLR